jgi:putative insertion element HTH domain-containing protein
VKKTEEKTAELTAKQVRAIEILLREPTITAAAKGTGISQTTIYKWLNDPLFAAAYRQARARVLESTLTALQAANLDAVTCLRSILKDKNEPASARVTAARTVLELTLKARDALETEERLRALEAIMKPRGA